MNNDKEIEEKPSFIERLKVKWGITSTFQVIIILVVFSVNGSLALKLARPVLEFFSVSKEAMSPILYWTLRILIIFPIYQVLLLVVGTLFGQFRFFWNFQKKTFGRFIRK